MAEHEVTQERIEITTADGAADSTYFRAAGGRRPGVLFLPDGIGVRDSQRAMARRVAELGYDVLLPNIYYRTAREPFFDGPPDFRDERTAKRFGELTGALTPDAMIRDGAAYVEFLASREEVVEPIAVVGFCFTGAFAIRIAASQPDRVAVAASFHGGRLVQDDPNSPHRLLPRVKARLYFGHARDDRGMPAEAIRTLEEALQEWGGKYESETYDALHGWTVPDSAAYDEPEAERAFAKLRAVLGEGLGA
jgi:carboxymethylenebutenolidase